MFLPRNYEANPNRQYKVLYMQDGVNVFWPGGVANLTWQVAQLLSDMSPCEIDEMIVVAIHSLDRDREYTPVNWADQSSCCGLDSYVDLLKTCIHQFMQTNYRICQTPDCHILAGADFGALVGLSAISRYPETFGGVGLFSPALWVGHDLNVRSDLIASINPSNISQSPWMSGILAQLQQSIKPIWMQWGLVRDGNWQNEILEEIVMHRGTEFRDLLIGQSYLLNQNLWVIEDENGRHDENTWQRHFPHFIQRFFPKTR